MSDIQRLTKKINEFRDARDWRQFHAPKDIALSLVLEAAEVLEHFQWKSQAEVEDYIKIHKGEIGEELADVLYWVLLMSHDLGVDIIKALNKKMALNEHKYPVAKARGRHTKYNNL